MRVLYHIARADFLERVRRYSFLITLACAVYAAWGFIPPNNAIWTTLSIHGTRGTYNSAWIGAQVAMLTSVFLTLVGFYLVKSAIDRDYHTRVGQIIAATPLSKLQYTVGKMLSNAAVLWAIVGVMIVVAVIMQFVRGEDRSFDLFALLVPFLYIMIPVPLLIASVAVLFECIPKLRGGLGNVVYFFLVMAVFSVEAFEKSDLFGLSAFTRSMRQSAMSAYPSLIKPDDHMNMGIQIENKGAPLHLETFEWKGANFTFGMLLGRLLVITSAFGIAGAASFIFDRFDSARAIGATQKKQFVLDKLVTRMEVLLAPSCALPAGGPVTHLTPLLATATKPRLFKTVMAELRIMLKGQHAFWYLGALALIVAGALVPIAGGQAIVLPIAWLWPTLIWSQMGCREVRQGTNQYVFAAASPITRQLPATWIAGVFVPLIIGSGVAIRFLTSGNLPAVAALLVGALFVPALALACGTWTNGNRLFEAVYLFWWYAGPLNHAAPLDYLGASGRLHTPGITSAYVVLSVGLIVIALLGRRRQLYV